MSVSLIAGGLLVATPFLLMLALFVNTEGLRDGLIIWLVGMCVTAVLVALVGGGVVLIEYGATGSVDWQEFWT